METRVADIVTVGNTPECVVVPFPSRSLLTKLVVIQTAGTPVNFDVDVYNSAAACADEAVAPLYQVLPQQAGVAGKLVYFESHGHPVQNQDVDTTPGTQGRIYVKITPEGAGPQDSSTFSVAVGGLPQN